MSQPARRLPASGVQPAPAPPAAAPAKKGFWPAPTGKPVGAGVEDTPVLLNRLQIIGMAAVLLFGLASGLIQFLSYQSDGRAADDTEQLLRVQEIQSSLLRADALATNAFLRAGREIPRFGRLRRDDRSPAAPGRRGRRRPARRREGARSADRRDQCLHDRRHRGPGQQPSAAGRRQHLSQPGQRGVRTDAQPILAELVKANTERAEDSMGGQHPFWLLLVGVLAIAVLVWLSMLLAVRFRRYVNVGIAVAGVIVIVTTLVASVAAWRGAGQNDDLLENELQVAVASGRSHRWKRRQGLREPAAHPAGLGATYEPKWEARRRGVATQRPSTVSTSGTTTSTDTFRSRPSTTGTGGSRRRRSRSMPVRMLPPPTSTDSTWPPRPWPTTTVRRPPTSSGQVARSRSSAAC